MDNPIAIGLVDDHRILLDGIELLLSSNENYTVILKEQSGEALLERASFDDIDLLIMDVNMDGKDGIQVLKELRERNYTGDCILLSSYDDLKLVNEAMSLGASGYVTKGSATEYLEEAIKTVINGGNYYSPDIQQRIITSFSKSGEMLKKKASEPSMKRQLTEREVEVLTLIAQQYTSEEISKKLYIAKSTVDTHRKNLIVKLKVKNAVGLGLYAQKHKLV